jgi:hypothetical protein
VALVIPAHLAVGRAPEDPEIPQAAPPEETGHDQPVPADIETQRPQTYAQSHTLETPADCQIQLSEWMAGEDARTETGEETGEETGGEGVGTVCGQEAGGEVLGIQENKGQEEQVGHVYVHGVTCQVQGSKDIREEVD